MNSNRTDPKKQFSKWLARYGAWFWGFYLIVIAALIYFRPEAAIACVYLALILTANKAIDTVAYTRNSTTEKIILGVLDRTLIEIGLKNTKGSITSENRDDESPDQQAEEEDVEDEEEGGAG